jgi:hypothetical protein
MKLKWSRQIKAAIRVMLRDGYYCPLPEFYDRVLTNIRLQHHPFFIIMAYPMTSKTRAKLGDGGKRLYQVLLAGDHIDVLHYMYIYENKVVASS